MNWAFQELSANNLCVAIRLGLKKAVEQNFLCPETSTPSGSAQRSGSSCPSLQNLTLKELAQGTAFKGTKGSWRAAEGRCHVSGSKSLQRVPERQLVKAKPQLQWRHHNIGGARTSECPPRIAADVDGSSYERSCVPCGCQN